MFLSWLTMRAMEKVFLTSILAVCSASVFVAAELFLHVPQHLAVDIFGGNVPPEPGVVKHVARLVPHVGGLQRAAHFVEYQPGEDGFVHASLLK